MSENSGRLKLHTLLGDYKNAMPLKNGQVTSSSVELSFADVKVPNTAFKRVVRDIEFDVAELAIATFLQAKAWDKKIALLPAVIVGGKAQHASIVYNKERGKLNPKDIVGRRVGIRASSQTTVMWVRGILKYDYGVDVDNVKWITFEDPHVPEYRDPPNCERAAPGKKIKTMLDEGELDAACLGGDDLNDPKFLPLIPEPVAAAREWCKREQTLPINHMLVVSQKLLKSNPDAVREVFRMISDAKKAAGMPTGDGIDALKLGVEANRKGIEIAIKYATQQQLIPRSLTVDELFDDVTRALGK